MNANPDRYAALLAPRRLVGELLSKLPVAGISAELVIKTSVTIW
jgi:hypothetical protein